MIQQKYVRNVLMLVIMTLGFLTFLNTPITQSQSGQVILVPSFTAPTIQIALQQARSGDTIEIDGRFYSSNGQESIFVDDGRTKTGLSEVFPITIGRDNVRIIGINERPILVNTTENNSVLIEENNVHIENLAVLGGGNPFRADGVENITLLNNNIEGTGALHYHNVTQSSISGNRITKSRDFGIIVERSEDVEVRDNQVRFNEFGERTDYIVSIYVAHSSNITIMANTIANSGPTLANLDNYFATTLIPREEQVQDNSGYTRITRGVMLENSNNNSVEGNLIFLSGHGVDLFESHDNRVINNEVISTIIGVTVQDSDRNVIEGQTNSGSAMALGIVVNRSNQNEVMNNDMSGIEREAIRLFRANENLIKGNLLTGLESQIDDPDRTGIYLKASQGNVIDENTISNRFIGILLLESYSTQIDSTNVVEGNNHNVVVDFFANEYLIKFRADISFQQAKTIIQAQGLRLIQHFASLNIYHVELFSETDPFLTLLQLQSLSEVEFAEFNGTWQLQQTKSTILPTDPGYELQWNIQDVGAPLAWEQGFTTSADIGIGIIDSGIELDHIDLSENIDSGNGANAFADDSNPNDDLGHGTFIASIIGARQNNEGIVGISWDSKMIPFKVARSNDDNLFEAVFKIYVQFFAGTSWDKILDGADQVKFLVDQEALASPEDLANPSKLRIINFSIGGNEFSQSLYDMMKQLDEVGILVVAASGNDGENIDDVSHYPCSYSSEKAMSNAGLAHLRNILCVASINEAGTLSGFSNYGHETVHIAAPGENVIGLVPSGEGGNFLADNETTEIIEDPENFFFQDGKKFRIARSSGTSFAAPHAAAIAALIMQACPDLSSPSNRDLTYHLRVKQFIIDHAIQTDALRFFVKSNGKLHWPEEFPNSCLGDVSL